MTAGGVRSRIGTGWPPQPVTPYYREVTTTVLSKGTEMKRIAALAGVGLASVLALGACSSGSDAGKDGSAQSETATEGEAPAGEEVYVIGISQLVDHPSLTAAADGFKAALNEAGVDVTFDEQNANGDQSVAASIAGSFESGDHDLILAIATPTAQAAAQAIPEKPVLFTAVTDPVDAGLVESLDEPGANITGTSDANPVEQQLELITEIVPDTKTVGIIYSPGEANSLVQVEWAEEAAKELGLELVEAPAVTTADVLQAAESIGDVDAIYVPTDNVVVSALESVLQVGEERQIPVFGAEGDSVERGAVATYGLDYYELGYQTGEMALQILRGEATPSEIPVATLEVPSLYLNPKAAELMGVTIPETLLASPDAIIVGE